MLPIYTKDLNPTTLEVIEYGKNRRRLSSTHRTTTKDAWNDQMKRMGRYGDYIVQFGYEELDGETVAVETWLYKPENTSSQR